MPFVQPGPLIGPSITLEPIRPDHREDLRLAAAGDDDIWTYFPVNFNGAGGDFDAWFDFTLSRYDEATHYPFAVRRQRDDTIIGTTRYYDMSSDHRRLAIGSTWYSRDVRGSLVNSEVRLLTLRHAFEQLGMNRVELITDPRNLKSRAAMRILGAVQEGIIRSHMIYKDGRVRDSLLFSIIKAEWPAVKKRLLERLGYEIENP